VRERVNVIAKWFVMCLNIFLATYTCAFNTLSSCDVFAYVYSNVLCDVAIYTYALSLCVFCDIFDLCLTISHIHVLVLVRPSVPH